MTDRLAIVLSLAAAILGNTFSTGLNNGAGYRYPRGPEPGGNGIYKQGRHKGLQAHGCFILEGPDWGVFRPDTIIRSPQFNHDQRRGFPVWGHFH